MDKEKTYKTLKPWQGVLVIAVAVVYLFFVTPKILGGMGVLGRRLGEAVFH